jgi:hypothetical protein
MASTFGWDRYVVSMGASSRADLWRFSTPQGFAEGVWIHGGAYRCRGESVGREELIMANPLLDIQQYGQSIWYDNIRRGLITSGELQSLVDNDGLMG